MVNTLTPGTELANAGEGGNGVHPQDVELSLGAKGLSIWGGHVTEEYLTSLRPWTREIKVYLEMRDDPVIGAMLDAVKMPIMAAPLTVKAVSDDARDVAAAEFLQNNLDNMQRQTWASYISDALECLDFGFSLGEIVLEKRDDGHLWLRNIEPRGQETLRRWLIDPEGEIDDVVGFEQGGFGTSFISAGRRVPLEKCVHLIFRGRKGNPQGKAVMRSVYRPWRFAKNLENFEGVGVERDVGGMPVAELGEVRPSASDITDLKKSLENLRMDEQMYMIVPQGVKVTAYGAGGAGRRYNVREIIRDKHKEILMRLFSQFLALGMEKVGTQALVQGSQDFFMLGLESIQDLLTATWQQQLVPYLFAWNPSFAVDKLPKLVWAKPGKVDIDALLTAYQQGISARLITPLRADEERVREALDAPELADDEGNEPRGAAPAPPGGDNPFGFAEPDLRGGVDAVDRFTDRYQLKLVEMYDGWAVETSRLAALPGRTAAATLEMFEGRLERLGVDLKMLGRDQIGQAARMGLKKRLGKHVSSPRVQQVVAGLITKNDQFIDGSLIPSLRQRFVTDTVELVKVPGKALRLEGFKAVLATRRSQVAGYAGGAVVAIFESQKAAGSEENAERVRAGEKPIPVRWVLDPAAEHCADDSQRATFGCPGLDRVYTGGWDELVAVPAGNVSCLGNCRCQIEADFGEGWERVT